MIILDIGILMDSQSNEIWEEMVSLYPGAKELSDAIATYPTSAPDPRSDQRRSFQLVLAQASQGVREAAAKFIEDAQGLTTHEEVRDLMVKYHDQNCKHVPQGQIEDAFPEAELYTFNSIEEAAEWLASVGSGPEQ